MDQNDFETLSENFVKMFETFVETRHGGMIVGNNNCVHVHFHFDIVGSLKDNLSLAERICDAITDLVDEGLIVKKKDFAAIHRIVWEQYIPEIRYSDFISMVAEKCELPASLIPTSNNIKHVIFSSAKFPGWKIEGADTFETSRMKGIAARFVELMK